MKLTFIRNLDMGTGEMQLYKLSEPATHTYCAKSFYYVVISATMVLWEGPETYIFAADETGEILSWSELPGSFKGGWSHNEAALGFEEAFS